MSDSGDSDDVGYMAAQSSDHDPELENDSDDDEDDGVDVDDGDELDASSDGLSESNDFFDLEAADSDDDVSSSGDSNSDQDHDEPDNHFFPQFKRLPFELRHSIWEFFCPDLTARPRVLWFNLSHHHRRDGSKYLVPVEGPFLDQQTRPARAMLAVHQESRQLIQRVLPDTLSFGHDAVLHFNAERDIVQLSSRHSSTVLHLDNTPRLPGFGEHIRHLALDVVSLFTTGGRTPGPARSFENLQAVYYVTNPFDHKRRHLRWCFSGLANRYVFDTFEEHPGIGEDGQHIYSWPDTRNPGVTDETKVPLALLIDDLLRAGYPAGTKFANFNGAPIWPLVTFRWDCHWPRLENLSRGGAPESSIGESSGSETSGEEEPNEYESEGIDDSIIDDESESSDDDLLVVPLVGGGSSDQSEQEDGSSLVSSSPRPEGYMQDGTIDLTADGEGDMPRFSSPEPPSSETLQGSSDSVHESDSDQPAVRTSRPKRPRARVVDSDSDSDSDDAGPRKRARIGNHRNPIALSSDDENEHRIMRGNRRARTIISEDEGDEDDEDSEQGHDSTEDIRDRRDASSCTSSSEEKDDSEESDGGATVGKALTLAEKLQLHRENNPIPPSEDEDSEILDMGDDDYGARDYADFQDDEEDNEVAEEGEDDQYGLMEAEFDEEEDGY
ncbi:hypothetical protein F5144DRAFT_570293 [Chaetomium tenue]|uniref:Uncharacterized protein n=1 Tax=Chaetomium tenue TaxID=1854479 RepID=A0ACB7PG97_9PEZI|nr:hypothetical protein F5144DRAFT_570293 [Chaetomium globosum]